MSDPPENDTGLAPADDQLGAELAAERPVPAAAFRGALRRRLAAQDPGYGPRPPRLRVTVATLIAAGLLLIALAALVALGTS
jgi:hypothetical protein